MAQHNELGILGEKMAVSFLKRNGYAILEINWRYLKGEIDIIAQKKDEVAIVEVKTRSNIDVIAPEDAVNQKKKKLLIATANQYIIEKNLDVNVRFDIISIHKKEHIFEINHIEDAFYFF